MNYNNASLDEILSKVDARYSREEQNNIAFELVDALMDSTDDLEEDFDPMCYLAEYFSTAVWREWLVETFLEDEDEVEIDCVEGTFTCAKKYDCDLGDIIDVYDEKNNCIGYIRGNLDNFTEEELINEIKVMKDNCYSEDFYNDDEERDADDDEGLWNY